MHTKIIKKTASALLVLLAVIIGVNILSLLHIVPATVSAAPANLPTTAKWLTAQEISYNGSTYTIGQPYNVDYPLSEVPYVMFYSSPVSGTSYCPANPVGNNSALGFQGATVNYDSTTKTSTAYYMQFHQTLNAQTGVEGCAWSPTSTKITIPGPQPQNTSGISCTLPDGSTGVESSNGACVAVGSTCTTATGGSGTINSDGACVAVGSTCTTSSGEVGTIQSDGSCQPPGCPVTDPALGWALCPIFDGGQTILGALDTQINNFLYFPTAGIFSGTNNIQASYDNFRDIGLAVLVIAGLTMVISQAAGLEIFAAYTVRKALPRLVIATIGIALAWPFLQIAITFFDDIGSWTQNLIMLAANVQGAGTSYTAPNVFGVGSIEALFGGTILVTFLGGLGVFTLFLTALLALFVGFVILSIRWLVILVCILVAPLAIAAYVLPGTDRFWKFWRDALLGALLMYPIIVAFLAAGWAGSYIAGRSGKNLLALIIFFAPYFLLPFAFRLTTGLMSAVAGGVQGAHGGAFATLKKQRQNLRAQNTQKVLTGSRYQDRGIGGFINTAGRRASVGARGRFGFGRQGQQALALADASNVERTVKGNAALAALANNDDANAVLGFSGGTDAGGRLAADDLFRDEKTGKVDQERANEAIAAARAVGFNRANATAALSTMAQNKSRAVKSGDYDTVQRGINRLAGGNAAMANGLAYNFQYLSRSNGRNDLGGSWHQQDVQQAGDALYNSAVQRGNPTSQREARQVATTMNALGRTGINRVVGGHPSEVTAALKATSYMLYNGDSRQRRQAGEAILEFQNSLNYAATDNKVLINDFMAKHGLRQESLNSDLTTRINSLNSHDYDRGLIREPTAVSAAELVAGARVWGAGSDVRQRDTPGQPVRPDSPVA